VRAVLFDLDGTLVRSSGTPDLFSRVAERVFERELGPLDFRPDGMTDPEILARQLGGPSGGAPPITPRLLARFEVEWARALREAIAARTVELAALPGARDVVAHLASRTDCQVGVVTGNLRSSARVKLDAAGLGDLLSSGGYGSDAPSRAMVTCRALERVARAAGTAIAPSLAVVVGDTPHDAAAARAAGTGCVLVASGSYARDELEATGVATVLDGLGDPAAAVTAILAAAGPARSASAALASVAP
jgi:phosphoglycolate phosphatase-like HAD superfamily hydrolase